VPVSIVHIADAFVVAERDRVDYVYFDVVAQAALGIHSSQDLAALHVRIKQRAEISLASH